MALSEEQISQYVESYRQFLTTLNEHPDPSRKEDREALKLYACNGDSTQAWLWTLLMKGAWVAGLSYVSADGLLYHYDGHFIRILTSFRKGNPWDGYLTVASGGYVDSRCDVNPQKAVIREVSEELRHAVSIDGLNGVLGEPWRDSFGLLCETGPYNRCHHKIILNRRSDEKPPVSMIPAYHKPAHSNPVLAKVYTVSLVDPRVYEYVCDTKEQRDLAWRTPFEIVRDFGTRLCFDQAVPLYVFMLAAFKAGYTLEQLGF